MLNIITFIALEIYVVLSACGFIGDGVGLGRVFKTAGVLLDNPDRRYVRAFAVVQILERVMLLATLESICFWLIVDFMDGSAGAVGACLGVVVTFLVVGAVLVCAASLIGSGATFERGFVALLKSVDEPVKFAKGVRSVDFSNRMVTYIILDIILGEGEALRRYSIAEGGLVKAAKGAEVKPVVETEPAEVVSKSVEAVSDSGKTESKSEEAGKASVASTPTGKVAEAPSEGIDESGSHAGTEKVED